METIRIGLAYYNGSKYIKEQIDSLLNQDFDRSKYKYEILVTNDGSDEDNTNYIENLSSQHDEIVLVTNKPGLGAGRTFMKMFFDAKDDGIEYFYWCDQDDYWDPTKVRKQLVFLKDNIGSTSLSQKWNGKEIVRKPNIKIGQTWLGHQMAFNMKLFFDKFDKFTRESFEKAIAVNEEVFGFTYHDHFIKDIFMTCGLKFKHIHEYLVNHRVHENSLTNTRDFEYLKMKAHDRNMYKKYFLFYKKAIPIATGKKLSINKFNKTWFYCDPSPFAGWMRWKYCNFCMRFRLHTLYILPDLIWLHSNKKKYMKK